MHSTSMRIACISAFVCCPVLCAAPPTPDEIEQVRQAWYQQMSQLREQGAEYDRQKLAAWMDEQLAGWPLAEMNLVTLEEVAELYGRAETQHGLFLERVNEIARQPTADGAIATALLVRMEVRGPDSTPDVTRLLEHDGFEDGVRSGRMAPYARK